MCNETRATTLASKSGGGVWSNGIHHGCEAAAALADGVQAMQAVVVMTEKSCPSVVSCVCVGVRVC